MKMPLPLAKLIVLIFLLSGCQEEPRPVIDFASLSKEEIMLPENALAGMTVPAGVELELFAAEPMLINPTNIAVDQRGRVWVCEARNYRLRLNPGLEAQEGGDRILILEDTDQDGKADKRTVFYQGEDINAALGIAVLGEKVIVSASPHVFVFTDADGDDQPDQKEILFIGKGGVDHDHALHAFSFGPDGKFYFNIGNEVKSLEDKDGNPIVDVHGQPVNGNGQPYRQGMVFRCDPDGSNLEVLGHNFRNPYEAVVDAYGTVWQSDNDDDGNQGTRMNFVMEHGNYGYTDELTGAGWRTRRIGWHQEIPKRHWHLNDPGVVPNLLQNGAGSPTGLALYEGKMLPAAFQQQLLHCEALKNVVRAYPVQTDGAGYRADTLSLLRSKDQWFRPSDVAVAPDGSVFVADWYDPGVGGHKMGDTERGRIYRLSNDYNRYKIKVPNYGKADQLAQALTNPNADVVYRAWYKFQELGAAAEPVLQKLWKGEVPHHRARALWLLARLPGKSETYLQEALTDANENLRITALRIARQQAPSPAELLPYLQQVKDDPSAAVRREAAIALRHIGTPEAAELWADLALQYDGEDRWYLEALGIGSDLYPDLYFAAWISKVDTDWNTPVGQDIVWRSRSSTSAALLTKLIETGDTDKQQLAAWFRGLQFKPNTDLDDQMSELLVIEHEQAKQVKAYALTTMTEAYLQNNRKAKAQATSILPSLKGTPEWLSLVKKLQIKSALPDLLELYQTTEEDALRGEALSTYLNLGGAQAIAQRFRRATDRERKAILAEFGRVQHKDLVALWSNEFEKKHTFPVQNELVNALGSTWDGQHLLFDWVKAGKLQGDLQTAAVLKLMNCWNADIRSAAPKYLVSAKAKEGGYLPDVNQLATASGHAASGKVVFDQYCATCHQIAGTGVEFGPDLSKIGEKLAKKALYAAIIYPSAGINFGYEGYLVTLKDKSVYSGYIASQTDEELRLKMMGGLTEVIPTANIASITPMEQSLMTPNLQAVMSQQELVDLVEYLSEGPVVELE